VLVPVTDTSLEEVPWSYLWWTGQTSSLILGYFFLNIPIYFL